MEYNKPENAEALTGNQIIVTVQHGHTPVEVKTVFTVISGMPGLFFVGGVLPKPGQKVEWVCTGSSETEVEIQLRAVQE